MTPTAPKRRIFRRPSRPVSIAICVVAFIAMAVCGIRAVQIIVESLNGPSLAAPGRARVHLDSGRWMVFESGVPTLRVSDVTVSDVALGERGGSVVPRTVTGSETLTKNSRTYTAVAEFTAEHDGDYDIEVRGGFANDVVLNRPITDVFASVGLWALGTIFALAMSVLFLVLAIVQPRPPGQPAIPFRVPAGWYPDPANAANVRWWDGYQWTPHTHPR